MIRWVGGKFKNLRTFFLSWIAGTGLIATTSVCPYCGQPGCAVGIGQATIFGLLMATALRLINRKKEKPVPSDHDEHHQCCSHEQ